MHTSFLTILVKLSVLYCAVSLLIRLLRLYQVVLHRARGTPAALPRAKRGGCSRAASRQAF